MKKFKKFMGVFLAGVMIVSSLAACGEKVKDVSKTEPTKAAEATKAPEATVAPTEVPEVVRDLGGLEVVIGNWWEGEPKDPSTTYEEDLAAYREMIQEKYNFKITVKNIGGWGEFQELFTTSVMANSPQASVYVLDSRWVPALLNQGLFYPVNELESFNFEDEKWNQAVNDLMTFNGQQYGFATGVEPRLGVFFNKRLFEDAGISPELPYDLQASGQWTWDEFKKLAQQLTVDKDNDGVIDTYGLASFSADYFTAAVYSNDAKFVGKDENGLFYNATQEPNFLEALQWARSIYDEGYVMPKPEGSEWNWFESTFPDGKVAMRVAEDYSKGNFQEMSDDWGFVMFPAGPKGKLVSTLRENIYVIPSSYDAKTADDIAFAYDLYTNPLEGYEKDETWKLGAYGQYRDARAVDETIDKMRNGELVIRTESYVYGLDVGDIVYALDSGEATPQEKIEEVQQSWNALIDDANRAISK